MEINLNTLSLLKAHLDRSLIEIDLKITIIFKQITPTKITAFTKSKHTITVKHKCLEVYKLTDAIFNINLKIKSNLIEILK